MLTLLLSACTAEKMDDTSAVLEDGTELVQLSFEAIPGNGFDIGGHIYDTSAASYAEKEAFTDIILSEVLPNIVAAAQVDPSGLDERLTPGGFQLATSPSLQIRGQFTPEMVDNFAAALGWSTYQWSVLETNFSVTDGGTGYGTVHFSAGMTPELAQSFFEHAAAENAGLGGGYTSFGDDLIFLNLRDSSGAPYSGIEDDVFVSALTSAAGSFTVAVGTVSASGQVEAKLIENDWGKSLEGQDYLGFIDDAEEPALLPVRDEYVTLLSETGATNGWY